MASTPAALRGVVESAVALPDPEERRRVLGALDRQLADLQSRVRQGLDDSTLQEQGRSLGAARLEAVARGEADLRRELVDRGLATDEQMAALGYPSHDDVDALSGSGALAEWAANIDRDLEEVASILPSHHLAGPEFNSRVRRGFHGRFASKGLSKSEGATLHSPEAGREMRKAEHLTPLAFGGQRTPAVVEQLGEHPNTRVKHTVMVGGRRVYTAERGRLHRQIVERMLAGAPAQEHPEALYLAGGPGSGKTTALDLYAKKPKGAATLELDAAKAALPEFQALSKARDPYASDAVHRESADILHQALREAERRRASVIVDGVGDSGPGQFAKRLTASHEAGYRVHVFYADAPTSVARHRAEERAKQTGRAVPDVGLEAMHANVPRAFHEDVSKVLPHLASLEMFDVRGDMYPSEGKAPELPVRHAHMEDGRLVVDDAKLHEEFLAKRHETEGRAVRHESFV